MSATYGITGKLNTGVGASWVRQSSTPANEKQRANALGATGQEVASTLYDSTDNVSESWVAKDVVDLAIPDLGSVVDDYVITSIKLGTSNTGYATLEMTGHKHTDGTPGMTCATGGAALITAAFGALTLGCSTSGVLNSSTIEYTCQHAEAKGATGDNVAGENYDAKQVVTLVYIDGGVASAGAGDVTSTSTSETNTGYQVKTITGTKALTLT
jgi:hypothetical protein